VLHSVLVVRTSAVIGRALNSLFEGQLLHFHIDRRNLSG
jgi:hypothetical protein